MDIKEVSIIWQKYPQYNDIKYFVETGTYRGWTIFHMANHFEKLYTIELDDRYYKNAVNIAKKKNVKNINFYLGDSAVLLKKLAAEIKEPAVFYLDGHFCGLNSDTADGNCLPLLDEVKAIGDLRNYNDIIIIDDYRLFGKQYEDRKLDWREATEENIMRHFNNRVFSQFVKNDRLHILLKKV